MFTINQGFDLNSPQFNFKRDYFATVAELKAADENGFPDHFITNVGGVLYQLTKSNSVDTTTGKWRKVKLGSDVDLSKYGTSLGITPGDDHANSTNIDLINGNTRISSIKLNQVNTINAGLMSVADKAKLDGIDKDHIVYNDQDNTISGDLTIEGKIKSTDTDITVDTGKIQFNSSSDGILFSGSEDATYLKIDGKNSSDTKVYNTNGGLTDVSVYAKSATVSDTYAAKNKAFGSVVKTAKAGYVGLEFKYVDGSSEGMNNIGIFSATTTESGVMSADDKKKLDGIAANANNYTLPTASTTVKGGVQLGYTATGKNYPLNVDSNGKAYVNVPWTDTKTDISDCAKLSKDNTFSGNSTFMKDALFAGAIKISDGLIINQDTAIKNGITTGAILHIQNIIGNGSQTANPAGISTNGGTANKLFATDGSLFDASTLATKTSLDDYVSNQGGCISTMTSHDGITSMTIGGDSTNGHAGFLSINGTDSHGDSMPRVTLVGASGTVTANKFVKDSGTSAQFLKADGSVDSNTYVTTNTVQALSNKTFTNVTTAKGFSAMETNNRASNKFFATDGTIQETVAITEDEINALF